MEKLEYQFHYQHGWAFESSLWNPLKEELTKLIPDSGHNLLERAYFDKFPNLYIEPAEKENVRTVAICHSLGLHLIPQELLRADYLVLIGCFKCFHPADERAQKRSQRVVSRMTSKLEANSEAVISDFHSLCFQGDERLISAYSKRLEKTRKNWNPELLKADLEFLDENTFNLNKIGSETEVIIVHGKEDQVVSLEQAEELCQQIEGSRLEQIEQGSHGLPLQKPDELARIIESFTAAKQSKVKAAS